MYFDASRARRSPDLVIRPPEPGEARVWTDFLLREQRRTYGDALPPEFGARHLTRAALQQLDGSFADPGEALRRMALADDVLVGVAATSAAPASWELELGLVPAPAGRCLDRLYVAVEAHGTGLGDRLFDAVTDCEPLYLWLIDGNARAAAFYERRGFRHLDERAETGPSWGHLPMHRMVRPGGSWMPPQDAAQSRRFSAPSVSAP